MTLALIAGTGALPPHLVRSLMAEGRPPIICEMRGFPAEVEGQFTRLPFRIETLGTLLEQLKGLGVTQVCMAGAMRRPQVDPSAIDAATAPLVPVLMEAMAKGDDGTLRGIVALFEERGFEIVGAHQIAPDLLPPAGVLTKTQPPELSNDLAVAVTALAEMGRADLGQAMLVRGGHVIAREDDRGTDALLTEFIARPVRTSTDPLSGLLDAASEVVGDVADWLSGSDHHLDQEKPGHDAFLYKAPKPGQLQRVDMPTIGVNTAKLAAEAGLAGIVVAEGGVMILDRASVIEVLDAQNMFLWVSP